MKLSELVRTSQSLKHKTKCPELRARTCAIAIECPHGYDVCPQCDPCTCDKKK